MVPSEAVRGGAAGGDDAAASTAGSAATRTPRVPCSCAGESRPRARAGGVAAGLAPNGTADSGTRAAAIETSAGSYTVDSGYIPFCGRI